MRATSDDLDTARLVGIKVRPVFATVAGIAVATAALAGVFIGTIGTFDPLTGTNILIFAFEAVVIGGIGSLWGTLVGGVIMGVTQVVVGEADQAYAVLAVNLLFLAVLAVPGRAGCSPAARRSARCRAREDARMTRNTAVGSRDAEPAVTPVAVTRWSRTASAFTGVCVVAVLFLAVIPYVIGGPAEQPLITLLTFVAMASLWNLLAGFSGLTSFGQQAYIGVGAYALAWSRSTGSTRSAASSWRPSSPRRCRCRCPRWCCACRAGTSPWRLWWWRPRSRSSPRPPSVGGTTGVSVPGLAGYGDVLREALTYWATLAVAVVSMAGVYLLVRWTFGLDARAVGSDPVAAASSGVRVGRIRLLAYLVAGGQRRARWAR